VGACVGPRGSRVRMVVSELRGEKIDIIPHNDEPARFVAKALSPARVREVLVDDETKEATVIVPDDQLSLAIGREGQNARLAAKLTGWKVDIKSETEFSHEEELEYEEAEEADGRCAAVLSAGRRCPNAALEGSRYCGLPQHHALARFDTNQVTVLAGLSDEEVAVLADPDASDDRVAPLVERASAAFSEEEAGETEAEEAEAEEEPQAEVGGEEEPATEAEAEEQPAEEVAEDLEPDESVLEQDEPAEVAIDEDSSPEEPAGEAEAAASDGAGESEKTAPVGATSAEEPDQSEDAED
jgi:transcription termination/antitermination protein NusA